MIVTLAEHSAELPWGGEKKGIRGTVLLSLAVDEKGRTSDITVVSGHPLLVPITVEAVKRLHFRPYHMNGEAVSIQGYVSYVFKFLPNSRAIVILGPSQ
jgi:outer membrane biosynthesis protein TonB